MAAHLKASEYRAMCDHTGRVPDHEASPAKPKGKRHFPHSLLHFLFAFLRGRPLITIKQKDEQNFFPDLFIPVIPSLYFTGTVL